MNTKTTHLSVPAPKKAYKTPKVKALGDVKKLTLKAGSTTDAFGPGGFG